MFERVRGGSASLSKQEQEQHHQGQIFTELARDKKSNGGGSVGGRPVTVHFLDETQHVFPIDVS